KSRVAGIGPQVGFFFPIADREGYLNLRAYYEFNASNRLQGWTGYVTFSIEAPEQKSAQRTFPRGTSLPRGPRLSCAAAVIPPRLSRRGPAPLRPPAAFPV